MPLINSKPDLLKKITALTTSLILISISLYSQAPQNIPQDNTPTDWSDWSTWVIYVVLPVIIIVVLGYNRWHMRGKRDGR